MKIFRCIIALLILNPWITVGQNDFDWENKIPEMTYIPDSLKNEDAVIIFYYEDRKIEKEKSFINTAITIRKKIKILTKKGIQEHSFFRIKQSNDIKIEILDARTIKRNGVILDFESTEIKSLESKSQLVGNTKDLFFAVPGIEVGDEVEMICRYHAANFRSHDLIYFHQSIPVMTAAFSIDVPNNLLVKSNVYSGLELPVVEYDLQTNFISWISKNNRKVDSDTAMYLYPHLIYQLDFRNLVPMGNLTFDNWYHLIAHYEKSFFKSKIRDKKKFNNLWQKISNGETDKTILAQKIHDYLNEHISIVPLLTNEKSEGISYFLENKKADYHTLLRIYGALFQAADIEAKIAIGKSRNIGPIDLKIPTPAQISNFIFVVENQVGITLIVPKEETNKYRIHQLPKLLYGTTIYMNASSKRKKLLKINIPPQNK